MLPCFWYSYIGFWLCRHFMIPSRKKRLKACGKVSTNLWRFDFFLKKYIRRSMQSDDEWIFHNLSQIDFFLNNYFPWFMLSSAWQKVRLKFTDYKLAVLCLGKGFNHHRSCLRLHLLLCSLLANGNTTSSQVSAAKTSAETSSATCSLNLTARESTRSWMIKSGEATPSALSSCER